MRIQALTEPRYDIRQDMEDAILRLQPYATTQMAAEGATDPSSLTQFRGWAKMAIPVGPLRIVHVGKPRVGETKPSIVLGEVGVLARSTSWPNWLVPASD